MEERITNDWQLINYVRSRSLPALRRNTTQADMAFQELDLINKLSRCDSLESVARCLDSALVYIAMSKLVKEVEA